MRWLFALAVLGCGGGNQAAPDASSPEACTAAFEAALDRACAQPSDCTLVAHDDCCGVVELAVHEGSEVEAMRAEEALRACAPCPAVGCAHAAEAEDHRSPGTGQAIVATCAAGSCTSVVQ